MNVNNTRWWPRSTPCGGVDYIMPIMWTVQENGLITLVLDTFKQSGNQVAI